MNTRFVSFAFSAALLIVAALAMPSGAGAFGVENLKWEQTTSQASAHPYAALSWERSGGEDEDIRDLKIDLPAGVFANPESANPKCTNTQFTSDACPSNSQAGELSVTVKAMGLLDLTINGSVYVLTPDANQTATLGVALRPEKLCILFVFCAVPQKIFLKTGATIRTYGDSGLTATALGTTSNATIGIPLVLFTPTISADITINKLKFTFYGRTGQFTTTRVCGGFLNLSCNDVVTAPQGPYFFRQTGSCMPATVKVTMVSRQGTTASRSVNYTPTGCDQVPFDPSFVADPLSKDGGEPTPIDFTLNVPEADLPVQHALPKLVDLDLPQGSGLDLVGLSGVEGCTEAQLLAASCPATSIIGNAEAFSKYLPGPTAATPGLSGNVYAMGVGTQVPIAVELKGRGNTVVIFRGVMGTRGDRVYSTFDRVPELPYRQITVHITKSVYKNPQVCGPAVTNGRLTGFNGTAPSGLGTVVDRTSSYEVVNCDPPPETEIVDGPPIVSSIVRPTFRFTSSIPGSAFQCRIDEDEFEPCTSPLQVEPLGPGDHTFEVKAINGPTPDPTPATYDFTTSTSGFVVTPNIDVSDYQARAHPDGVASFAISGGQPRSVSLRMPDGVAASLSARERCPLEDAEEGNCPESSKLGVGSITVDTFGGGSETAIGAGYLTEAPTAADVAGIMATADFTFGRGTVIGGAYIVNNGRNQYLTLRDVPQVIGTTQINATGITVELDGSTNNLMTNPSHCNESSWLSTGVDWEGNDAEIFNIPFQATGCENVPFRPTFSQTIDNPVAGQATGVRATVTLEDDDSGIKRMVVVEPPSIAPNFPAFGQPDDQCPPSAAPEGGSTFDPTVCPPQARVGTMAITTPLLPYVLEGDVYLIEASPIPWLGVSFTEPGISVRLTGITSTPKVVPTCNPLTTPGGCRTQIAVDFDEIPDVPIKRVDFVLDGPSRTGVGGITLSGKMLRVVSPTDPSCLPSSPAKVIMYPHSGGPPWESAPSVGITGCV